MSIVGESAQSRRRISPRSLTHVAARGKSLGTALPTSESLSIRDIFRAFPTVKGFHSSQPNTHTHTHISAHMYTHAHTDVYIHLYVYIHTYKYIYTHTYVCIYIYIYKLVLASRIMGRSRRREEKAVDSRSRKIDFERT
jgi:hypothetical protein